MIARDRRCGGYLRDVPRHNWQFFCFCITHNSTGNFLSAKKNTRKLLSNVYVHRTRAWSLSISIELVRFLTCCVQSFTHLRSSHIYSNAISLPTQFLTFSHYNLLGQVQMCERSDGNGNSGGVYLFS